MASPPDDEKKKKDYIKLVKLRFGRSETDITLRACSGHFFSQVLRNKFLYSVREALNGIRDGALANLFALKLGGSR